MSISDKIRQAINNYDPYGYFQVTAAQALFVTTTLCLINFVFSIPHFTLMLRVPALGFLAIAMELNFNQRMFSMGLFCIICVTYACILTTFQFYPMFFVISVGVVIILLFSFSKTIYPSFLPMIPIVQVVTVLIIPPLDGIPFRVVHTFVTYGGLIILTVALMYLFPRIYFFRIFLRSFYLALGQYNKILMDVVTHSLDVNQFFFRHMVAAQNYAYALSTREHGLTAKKITLSLVNSYTFIVAVVNGIEIVEAEELVDLANGCKLFQAALATHRCIEHMPQTASINPAVKKIFAEFNYMMRQWNSLCLKT